MATSRKSNGKSKAENSSEQAHELHAAPPTARALKAVFAAGKIPVEGDFHDLIDLADTGAHLAADGGLVMDKDGNLAVQPALSEGIVVGEQGVGVNAGAGLILDQGKLRVTTGQGLTLTQEGTVKALIGGGLKYDGDYNAIAVKVDPDNCIKIGNDGLTLLGDTNRAIEVTSNGVGVKAGNGVAVGSGGVAVVADSEGPIRVGNNGINVLLGAGLIVFGNRLKVDLKSRLINKVDERGPDVGIVSYETVGSGSSFDMYLNFDDAVFAVTEMSTKRCLTLKTASLRPGMITMFAGDICPEGWVMCDGSKNTPNLTSRFVKDDARSKNGEPRYSLTYIMLAATDGNDAVPSSPPK